MATDPIVVIGADKVRRSLRKFEESAADLKDSHNNAAQIVVKEGRSLAPVRSGALRDSVRGTGQANRAVVRAGKATVPYAGVIHFGWAARNISPNPFLYDAADNRREEVLDTYQADLARLADEAGLDMEGKS